MTGDFNMLLLIPPYKKQDLEFAIFLRNGSEKELEELKELFQYLDKLTNTHDDAIVNNTREIKEARLDNVNHPTHYNKGAMECLDVIKACLSDSEFRGFLKGNVMKYMYRKGDKGDALEDLNKACWYAKKLMKQEDSL